MPNTIILIPARMASTRLPGKPLIDINGLPMIVHVLRRAEAAGIGEAVVATDSEAIQTAVEKSGGRAVMTRGDHLSGSDRIYEVSGRAGSEPLLPEDPSASANRRLSILLMRESPPVPANTGIN